MSVQPTTPGAGAAAALEAEKATRAEYGKYRALVPIDLNGARAFAAGDPVPVTHVEGGTQLVGVTAYDAKAGRHMPVLDSRKAQKLDAVSIAPVVNREDVYEIGKAGEDPNMDPEAETLPRPADGAALDKWQAFAVQQGMAPQDAADITDKAEFVRLYPKG